MRLNEAFYSTANQIEWSIQDQIDSEKLKITDLTKEKLQQLKVDIFDSRSHLNIRDENLNDIWNIRDNETLTFLWETKIDDKKLFLKVETSEWKIWYVAADYVKGEIKNIATETPIANNTPVIAEAPVVVEDPEENEAPEDIEIPEVIETPLTYKRTMIFEQGRVWLVWKDWIKTDIDESLSDKDLEKIKNFQDLIMLNNILEIWKNQANKVAGWLHWKSSRDDDDIILSQIENVDNKFGEIFNKAIKWENYNSEINELFGFVKVAEDQEWIIWNSDMAEIKSIFLDSSLKNEQKMLKILNIMRYQWNSWNSAYVKEKVGDYLLQQDKFKDIDTILKNPEITNYIKNSDSEKLETLWIPKGIVNEIIKQYSKIKIKQEKNKQNLKNLLPEWANLEEHIGLATDGSTMNLLKHMLLRGKIKENNNRWKYEESFEWLYWNISWLAEISILDWVKIADENVDTTLDIWITLALSAASMWVGMIAARATLAAAWWAARGVWLANLATKTWRVGSIARFAWIAWVEWLGFYEWTNLANNLIYTWIDWAFDNAWNVEEISKSIAFMWVLRWVWKVMESAWVAKNMYWPGINKTDKILANFWKITDKVPPLMFKWTSITWVLAEAWLLTGTSVWLEVVFEDEWNWSWEEYMQAIIMVWLFKGVWTYNVSKKWGQIKIEQDISVSSKLWDKVWAKKIMEWLNEKINTVKEKITKSKNTTNEVAPELASSQTKIYTNPKTWATYTLNAEGKFVNSKWKVLKNRPKNITEVKTPVSEIIKTKYIETITKEIKTLKEGWDSIKYWEYDIKKVKWEYIVEWPNSSSYSFKEPNDASKHVFDNLAKNNKLFEITLDAWTREMQAKLKKAEGIDIEIVDGEILRIREDWGKYKVQEKKGWWYKDIKLEDLTENQVNKLFEKIIWSEWTWVIETTMNRMLNDKTQLKDIFSWKFWNEVKATKWANYANTAMNWTFWDAYKIWLKETWWKWKWVQKAWILRNIFTWKSDLNMWGNWKFPDSWFINNKKLLAVWAFTGAEFALTEDKQNFNLVQEWLTNYLELATLWLAWIAIVEIWHVDNAIINYAKWIGKAGSIVGEDFVTNH